jgi:large subunit ribosomal protein L6|tara:strand:- start:1393 stop:1953 length:561 start_codon:yes stop_codon:yes gene_type:complete
MSTEIKKEEQAQIRFEVPEGVLVKFSDNILYVNGPLGEIKRDFSKIRSNISLEGTTIIITPFSSRKKHRSIMNTSRSLIRNMVTGVTKGFTYKLKVAYAHFPITVKIKGDEVHVDNFYGERAPRISKIVGDCKLEIQEDDVIVRGISLDDVGQTAANIEQATTVKKKDQRVFLDGVYIYEKRKDQH